MREHDCVLELDEWCNVHTQARLDAASLVTSRLLSGWELVRSQDEPWYWLRRGRRRPLSVDEIDWIENR